MEYRAELETIVRSAQVERDAVVAGNTLFDVKKVLACSALLVEPERSASGGPLLGRNLDYPSLGYAHEYSLVTIYRPAGAKHAFAAVGFPGMVGCLSGMNDAGLALSILEVFQVQVGHKRYDSHGVPYALCYRRLLEECATIEEAQALLERMERTTITNLVLADRRRTVVLEVTPRQVVVRPPQRGTCICTNHFCTRPLKPFMPFDLFHTFERFDKLEHITRIQEQFGVADVQYAMHTARMGRSTMQTMVFEPAALRLHLAIGACPSSGVAMKTLDLAPLFAACLP
jgi:predicted choloylglycine hydrolase